MGPVPCRTLCSRVAAATDVGRVLAPRFCRLCPNPNLWASRALSAAQMSRATAWGGALFSCVASVSWPHRGRLLSSWQLRRSGKIVSRSRSMLPQAMAACGHSVEHTSPERRTTSRLGTPAQTLCAFACISAPSNRISPLLVGHIPIRRRASVVFPAAEGPIIISVSPGCKWKLTPLRIA